jgi:SAM-dependent methyltransferase
MAEESVSFDRAAEYYDKTRSLLPGTMERVLGSVVPELRDAGRVLEIGAGTGRFTRPLKGAGLDIYGSDISLPMLEKLVETSVGGRPPLVVGDATRLPFVDDSFGAGVGVHILHLIPDWKLALQELGRVIEPGGKFLLDVGDGWDQGEWLRMRETFVDAAGIETTFVGAKDGEEVDAAMTELGATVRFLPEVTEVRRRSYRDLIDALEGGLFSFTWRTDDEGRKRGANAMRRVLADEGKSQDDFFEFPLKVRWRVYDLP